MKSCSTDRQVSAARTSVAYLPTLRGLVGTYSTSAVAAERSQDLSAYVVVVVALAARTAAAAAVVVVEAAVERAKLDRPSIEPGFDAVGKCRSPPVETADQVGNSAIGRRTSWENCACARRDLVVCQGTRKC